MRSVQKSFDKRFAISSGFPKILYVHCRSNLSQKQLAALSGVKLRSIKCYEQGDIDIRNAQAETLYALAKVLDCSIEDLIK